MSHAFPLSAESVLIWPVELNTKQSGWQDEKLKVIRRKVINSQEN
jgi:hypothetical protein